MWPPFLDAPAWTQGRHYVTADEALKCRAFEALAHEHEWEWRVTGSVCKVCGIEQREAFAAERQADPATADGDSNG